MEVGAIDEMATDPTVAAKGADLVILCTPVGAFSDILRQISPVLHPGAIITDVGSTKGSVVEAAAKQLPASVHFVGSHPMAGSEKRGVEFARADLFKGALCILTPTAKTNPSTTKQLKEFWQQLGMRLTEMSPEDHDRLVADISHLPHAVAAALVAMQSDPALKLAGRGFLDATRIASGDGGLWRDILLDNRDNIRAGVERLQQTLASLLEQLDRKDAEGLRQWLDAAAAKRENWARQKLQELNPE